MKKIYVIIFILAAAFSHAQQNLKETFIGIAMPNSYGLHWIIDSKILKAEAEKRGFRAEIQWAENEQEIQNEQIMDFLNKGAKALIIANVYDNDGLTSVLSQAARKRVPVISYDRLIKDADYDYYITFNHSRVGNIQAQSIVSALNLENISNTYPQYITLFAGSPSDIAANRFYDGAMEVLNPYIDRGVLKVIGPYPRTSDDRDNYLRIATDNWEPYHARSRMENLLYYDAKDVTLDAVLAPNDRIARGIIEACKFDSKYENKLPVICGLDGDFETVISIKNGEQYSTVFMDTSKMAKAAIILTEQILLGKEPIIPGGILATGDLANHYHNGIKLVKAYLLDPILITKENLDVLIRSDRFNSDEIKILSINELGYLLFAPDSTNFENYNEAKDLLDQYAKNINEISSKNKQIYINGFTAIYDNNIDPIKLSYDRANIVLQELVSRGISAERFDIAKGNGGTEEWGNNAVSKYRRLNRRVTISIDTLKEIPQIDDIQETESEIKGNDLENNVTKNKSFGKINWKKVIIVVLIIIAVIGLHQKRHYLTRRQNRKRPPWTGNAKE
jgi:putative multiple sugar transport system substrate-binding protein